MSNVANRADHFAPADQPPNSGFSKVWLPLGVGCGAVILLCCGGVVGLVVVFENAKQVTRDPEAVRRQGAQIADFEPPAGLGASMAVTLTNPLTRETVMEMVIYSGSDHEPGIVVTEYGESATKRDSEQMKVEIDGLMKRQGQQMKRVDVAESRDVEVEIRGQPAIFKIQKAEDQETKQRFVQVDGTFEGKQGTAMLIGQLKADQFTEADAEKFVRSIR